MEDIKNQDGNRIGWEEVLSFLHEKRKLVTKYEVAFNKRKQDLDVS